MQRLRALAEILDGNELRSAILFQPRIRGVADDGQNPCARIRAVEARNRAKGAQRCVLHDVLRVRAAAGEPACERKRCGQMRYDYTREPRPVDLAVHIAPVDFALATLFSRAAK